MEIKKEGHNKIIIGNEETGFIVSQTVEACLLYAILEKLEEIRCGIIDIESLIEPDNH